MGLRPSAFGLLLAHDQHGGGAIAGLAAVAGGDAALGMEDGAQLAQCLDGRVAANALILVKDESSSRPRQRRCPA